MTDDGGRRGEGMPPEIPQPPCARPSASCLTARMIWFAIANAERPFELLLLAATRYAAARNMGNGAIIRAAIRAARRARTLEADYDAEMCESVVDPGPARWLRR